MLSQLGSKAHLVDRKMYPPLSRTAELYHELLMTNRIKLNKKKKNEKRKKRQYNVSMEKNEKKLLSRTGITFSPT